MQLEAVDDGRGQRLAAASASYNRIPAVHRLGVALQGVALKIDEPCFWNAGGCVQAEFDPAIVSEGAVGHFNDQEHIFRPRQSSGIEVVPIA